MLGCLRRRAKEPPAVVGEGYLGPAVSRAYRSIIEAEVKRRHGAVVSDAVCLLFGKTCERVEQKYDSRLGPIGHYMTVRYQDGTEYDWFPHFPGRRRAAY